MTQELTSMITQSVNDQVFGIWFLIGAAMLGG